MPRGPKKERVNSKDIRIEISEPGDDLRVELQVSLAKGPGSEAYKKAWEIEKRYQLEIGRPIGFTIHRVYRGVYHIIELREEGWVLNDAEWFPTLKAVQERLIDPEGTGGYKSVKRVMPEFFFSLPWAPSKRKVRIGWSKK